MNYKRKIFLPICLGFLGAVLAILLEHFIFPKHIVYFQENTVPVVKTKFSGIETDFVNAAEKSVHAVVHVKTSYDNSESSSFFDYIFGEKGMIPQPMQGTGSGVIISSDGYIVTNNHVIEKCAEILVVLNDKRTFRAKVIGSDPTTDVALMKISGENLPFIALGNSDNLKIGEWVLAVGNPFNLTSTVTAGIVSAKGRNINILNRKSAIESFIQTDAAVNPGNSGGALVNTNGELVGINTAIASNTGSFAGYSFAIPVTIIQKVVADLKEYGKVQRAVLGIDIVDIDENIATENDLDKIEGVLVTDVDQTSAAWDAGIRSKDVIVKIDAVDVSNVAAIQEQISKHRPGDKINVLIKRSGESISYQVILRNINGNTDIVDSKVIDVLGAEFQEISSDEKSKFNVKQGLKVINLTPGKLMKSGMVEGFIITIVNKHIINTLEDLHSALHSEQGAVFIQGINPDGSSGYFAFGLR